VAIVLRWSDLDPRTHAFDLDLVRLAIDRIIRTHAATFKHHPPRDLIQAEIGAAFVTEFGAWTSGWCWSPSEPGGGGPTHGWCCSRDSVFRADDAGPTTTAERALGALANWREYLELLDRMFARLRLETVHLDLAAEVEYAASRLLTLVAERTQCEDAWYNTMASALSWYLEAGGVADPDGVVGRVICGRFESWVQPDETASVATFAEVASRVSTGKAAPERDALADWRTVRMQLPSETESDRPSTSYLDDAQEHYIEIDDRARDPVRADRMAAALLVCRDAAMRGSLLTFDLLAEWQRIVLGASAPVPLRTSDAFAKRGRERYGTYAALAEDFEQALGQANDPDVPLATRAARVYLDVCFFHPFSDGNARAARLALDYVLTAAGSILRVGAPIFALPRGADGLWSLERVIDRALGTLQVNDAADVEADRRRAEQE